MGTRVARSPEERAAWKERMGSLARRVRAMSEEERGAALARLGIITAEGHPLSPFNVIFLASQCAGDPPVQVGGVRQWRKVGRAVRKGEHAIGYIYVPMGKRGEESSSEGSEESSERMRFRLVPMFDVLQTIEVE